jgi:anti-sigma regulatory factor (Ser/Thr protein kinase)
VTERRTCVPGDAAQLPALSRFLQEFWTEFNLPAAAAHAFELALEEVFINVVMHGSHTGGMPRVGVSLSLMDGGVTLTVEDDGPPFDPLSLPAPDVTAKLEHRGVGGLGVFLVRQVMDSVSYLRRGTMNQLRMSKILTGMKRPRV